MEQTGYLFDYYALWVFGRLTLEGFDPYDQTLSRAMLSALNLTFNDPLSGHLPHTLWFYALFALLPFNIARICWGVFIGIATLFFSCLVFKDLNRNSSTIFPLRYLIVILSFVPLVNSIRWGQSNIIIALGIYGCTYFLKRGDERSAGLSLSFSTWKFHLLFPLYVYLVVCAIKERKVNFIVWSLGGVMFQLGLTAFLSTEAVRTYPAEFFRSIEITNIFLMPSLSLLMATLLSFPYLRIILPLLGGGIGVWLALRQPSFDRSVVFFLLSLSVLVSPYCWSHTFVVLFPVYASIVSRFWDTDTSTLVHTIVIGVIGLSQYWLIFQRDGELWLVGIPLVLTLLALKAIRFRCLS